MRQIYQSSIFTLINKISHIQNVEEFNMRMSIFKKIV